jgi:hypothetical protein
VVVMDIAGERRVAIVNGRNCDLMLETACWGPPNRYAECWTCVRRDRDVIQAWDILCGEILLFIFRKGNNNGCSANNYK